MGIACSKKIPLITTHHRLLTNFRQILADHNLEIAESYLNLHSIDIIRKAIHSTKNTTFLRSELLRFVREEGAPFFIAMDYLINTATDDESDHDRTRILRTILITFIILSRGRGFENLKCNLLLICDSSTCKPLEAIELQPYRVLDMLSTSDKIVNGFIDELKKDRERFNRLFFIKGINADEQLNDIKNFMDNYIAAAKARDNLIKFRSNGMTIDGEEREAARIVYRLDDTRAYIDGEIREIDSDELKSLEKQQFYVIGPWVNKNLVRVSDKIIHAVSRGLAGEKTFSPEDEIIFDMTERCSVDATTTPSLAQVLSGALSGFRITVLLNEKNNDLLSEAKGYSLIRKSLKISR